nr:immunoglobulin light chain junction region [Macaca mulatta]MOW71832.1 immunoglobulin light chain junction region [Macaca mulatta]
GYYCCLYYSGVWVF